VCLALNLFGSLTVAPLMAVPSEGEEAGNNYASAQARRDGKMAQGNFLGGVVVGFLGGFAVLPLATLDKDRNTFPWDILGASGGTALGLSYALGLTSPCKPTPMMVSEQHRSAYNKEYTKSCRRKKARDMVKGSLVGFPIGLFGALITGLVIVFSTI